MYKARTVSVSIDRSWLELYEEIWRPEYFHAWASGLSKFSPTRDGNNWKAAGPEGEVKIRFTDHNVFGVMDHYVDMGKGPEIYVPLRVIPNENGAEVLLTLFRRPKMTEAKFLADIEWVKRDLLALKALAES